MRRYVITLAIIAFLVGTLFRATAETGVRLMNMFATLGILMFGLIGSMALSRWQSRQGLKEIETALKALEPDWLITDWALRGGGRPDYVLAGPGGVVAICLDEVAGSAFAWRARGQVAKARERAQAAAGWVRERLSPHGDPVPVEPLVVLTRRKTNEEYSAESIPVYNPEQVAEHIRSLGEHLDEPARNKLTRLLRQE